MCRKLLRLTLAVLLCAAVLSPAMPAAAEEVIRIADAEDYLEFAENCRYDAWSVGKRVVLDNDIVLDPDSSKPIPSFGGVFDGQGYTISGLIISGEEAYTGLFGTVQEGGAVRNLRVNGTVQPSGIQTRLGGIAGTNCGLIEDCSFNGLVSAHAQTGGIAGRNMQTGEIRNCLFYGSVQGDTYTGGIAGYNEGLIRACVNRASVNTVYSDVPYTTDKLSNTLENILLTGKLTSSENIDARIDTGGIAGLSTGIIAACVNEGNVGYEHVGYNTGGIVGRSSGFVRECTNEGQVIGRKDIGGIAGQLQPFLQLDFSDSLLGDLDTELDTLNGQLTHALDRAGDYSADVNKRLRAMLDQADRAKGSVRTLTDEAADTVDRTAANANKAADALNRSISAMSDVAEGVSDYVLEMKKKAAALDGQIEDFLSDSGLTEEEKEAFREAYRRFRKGTDILTDAQERLKNLAGQDPEEDLQETLKEIYEDIRQGYGMMQQASKEIRELLGTKELPVDIADADISSLREAFASLLKDAEKMPDIGGDVTDALDELAGIHIRFSGVSGEARQAGNDLYDSLGGMLAEMNGLNAALNSDASEAIGDFKNINDQVGRVVETLEEIARQQLGGETDAEEKLEDISAENIDSATQGRTTSCVNRGAVEADSSAGGIAGTIGIEYDFDPEQDIQQIGNASLDYIFRARGIIDASENLGSVRCRNNYSGGIAGNMEMGVIAGCCSTGTVESTGDYAGGIAGYSAAGIQDCSARCDVSGTRYVGGIAGYGTRIFRTAAMVNVVEADQFAGAVAGWVKETDEGSIADNVFYSDSAYGIGGVGYRGMAEPVSYEELAERETERGIFDTLYLTFVAEDGKEETLECHYGEDVEASRIPRVPEKEGFSGRWTRQDYRCITKNETIHAVYDRIVTLLAAPEKRGSGLSVLFAEGNYRDTDRLDAIRDISAEHVIERWNVLIPEQIKDVPDTGCRLRFLPPEGAEDPEIWILAGETEEKVKTERSGKYLVFTVEGHDVTFEVREAKKREWPFSMFP